MSGGILLGIEFIGGASVAGIFKGVAGKVGSGAIDLKSPQRIWGRSADEISASLQAEGYQAVVRQSTRGSGLATIIEVKGHPQITQIQIHPGGGRHNGAYYKISTTTEGTVKVIDPATYKPTIGDRSTIIGK